MTNIKLRTLTQFTLLIVYLLHIFGTLALLQEDFSDQSQENQIAGRSFDSQGEDGSGIFSIIKKTSRQSLGFLSNLFVSIPFGKMLLAGGALLSLFFLFVRLIIVLAPILILGAMARESTDATDLIKMLIDFYNQVVIALDEQNISDK